MPKYTGTVRKNDLEGGFFELVADDGTVYRLEADGPLSDGDKVVVHGTTEAPGFGIHMTSNPVIVVEKVEPA